MNKVFIELVKVQLATAYLPMINMFNRKKKNGAVSAPVISNSKFSLNGNQIGAILLMGYLFVNICFFIGVMSFGVLEYINDDTVIWSFMSFIYVAALLFSIVGSVAAAKSYMFDAKDNELLFSMPIKTSTILLSRLVTLYLLDCIFSIIVILPAGIVYAIAVGFTISSLIFYLLSIFLLPVFATAICSLLGFLLGFLASKLHKVKLLTSLLGFVAFGAYFLFIFNLTNIMDMVGENIVEIAAYIRMYFPPAYFFGIAVANGDMLYMLYSVLIFVVPSLLIFYLILKNFQKIATSKPHVKHSKYVEKPMKKQSPTISLLRKELGKVLSSSSYTFNCASGSFFALLLAGFVIVQGPNLLNSINQVEPKLLVFAPIVVASACSLLCSMNDASAPSISLEAKTLWILKSTPISFKDIIIAKALVVPVVSVFVIFVLPIASAIVLNISVIDTILIIIIAFLSSLIAGFLGVYANLIFPKFDWVNEAIAVKQGASVFISLFGAMFVTSVPIAVSAVVLFLTGNSIISLTIIIIIMLIFIGVEILLLKNHGKKLWLKLEEN